MDNGAQTPVSSYPFPEALRHVLTSDSVLTKQAEWASFLNVTPSAVSQWANGRTIPKPHHLHAIILHATAHHNPFTERLTSVTRRQVSEILPPKLVPGEGETTLDDYMTHGVRSELAKLVREIKPDVLWELRHKVMLLLGRDLPYKTSGARHGHHPTLLNQLAASALERLGATSVTIYLSDPHYVDEFVLVAHAGLRYPEAMSGPWMARIKHLHHPGREFEEPYVSDPVELDGTNPDTPVTTDEGVSLMAVTPTQLPSSRCVRELYDPLLARERIRSFARVTIQGQGESRCVVYANYDTRQSFVAPPASGETVREQLHDLAEMAEAQRDTALAKSTMWERHSRSMVAKLTARLERWTPRSGNSIPQHGWSREVGWMLQALSDQLALTANGKRPTATVHVPCNRRITHIVAVPILEDPGAETSLECLEREKGIGLPLWASLRKRTLWIRDLHASPFWNLATQREQQFTSLLVIPTFQADRLVAVIQLAWREPHDIDHAVLRPLAMATNQMMAKLESFARQSLTTLWGCLTQRVEDASRHEFFDIASRHFGVRDCDIWRVASDHKERLTFEFEGSTYGEQPGSPRHNGWSAYVHTHGTHVYITRSPTNEPNVYEWDEDIGTWGSPRHDERPSSVNEVLTTLGVDAELGVPLSWGEARGVLWLKFQANATCDPRIHHPPGPHLMFAVRLFARSASRTMLSQTPRSPQRREPEVVIDKARASTVATLQTEPVLAEARQLNGKYSV